MNEYKKELALALFNIGAIQDSRLNLQRLLSPEILATMGRELYKMARNSHLRYVYVAGVPGMSESMAEAFSEAAVTFGDYRLPVLKLSREETIEIEVYDKETREGGQVVDIVAGKSHKGERVLLIADSITKDSSEAELEAIEILENTGLKVKDILGLIDGEQGGAEQWLEKGYNSHSVFTISELLELGRELGMITD